MNLAVDIFRNLTALMTAHANFFQAAGWACYGSCVLIVFVTFGSRWYGGDWTPSWHDMVKLFIRVGLTGMMLGFYTTPMPGFGMSFYQMLANLGQSYASSMANGLAQEIMDRLNRMYFSMEAPILSLLINFTEYLVFAITTLLIIGFQAVVLFMIALGYFAVAIGILIGPLMIPFVIVPDFEFLFWNWLRGILQYSFYPVFAYAFLFVFGQLIIHFVDSGVPAYDSGGLAAYFAGFASMMVASIGVALKITSICNSYFSGSSGQSTMWR